MTDIAGLSSTDASNTAITSITTAENNAPSSVNDGMRATLGLLHRWWERVGPTITSAGTNTVTLTYSPAVTAYTAGDVYSFIAGGTNTGATTLNINGLGAKNVYLANAALTGGEILSGKVYVVAYDGTQFQMVSPPNTGRGGLIGVQVFTTAGTSTYTPTAGANTYVAEVVGGGGGGGGCGTTGAGQVAAGQSGGGGGYARKRGLISAISGATITVGAKGTGGTTGANNGTTGGTSSIGAVVSATGGTLGTGTSAQTPPFSNLSGSGGTGSSGDINVGGQPGVHCAIWTSTYAISGSGGNSVYGPGAQAAGSSTGINGNNAANGYGGGGSGGSNAASQGTGKSGGDGTAGCVIIWEYA